ncbi:hypothetical protein D0817_05700 [Flavobacterium cupreum]|uniref:Uncharacterized protein n=1 Tax=Flavobacterium cupreum TaxID=2133766 RepID=A0A434AAH3_9FLAO|nr:hypothetical protein [Flavobacterium cupreum]RUT71368.1 hypothetical protein D0817_05700 [Flavobacterium cupreum]
MNSLSFQSQSSVLTLVTLSEVETLFYCKVQVSGFRFQVSGFRFQVSGFRFQVSGFRFQVSGFRFQVSGLSRRGIALRTLRIPINRPCDPCG